MLIAVAVTWRAPPAGLLVALFFAEYLLCETVLGFTPGRRVRGLFLADATGMRPRHWLLLTRCLLRLGYFAGFVYCPSLLTPACIEIWNSWCPSYAIYDLPAAQRFVQAVVGPVLAVVGLYLTSLIFSKRQPLHDMLTGITWCTRRRLKEQAVIEVVGAAQAVRGKRDRPQESAATGRMGQYQLHGLLGQGGMGAVFAGYDETLQRRVALKVLNASFEHEPALMQRFEREARLAAQLSHPNVARVFGVGQAEGKPFMVMEFIVGETLQQRVERTGPMRLARAWDFVHQAALALREATALGIIHRDIKPSNLMLAEGGVVKVTDFGLSRVLTDTTAETPSAAPEALQGKGGSLTKTGSLMGTPMYMSPEQARGEKLDAGSDIYSLGLTLYFLLNGGPPYEGDDVYDLVMKQCTMEPKALEGKVAGLTPERAAVLRRMIQGALGALPELRRPTGRPGSHGATAGRAGRFIATVRGHPL
jgi:predicted Ser/Thr protein kinase